MCLTGGTQKAVSVTRACRERGTDKARIGEATLHRHFQAMASISDPAKSRNCSVLDYLVLKTTLKEALSLESSNWSKMPSPISSPGKKGIQITVNTGRKDSDTPQRFFWMTSCVIWWLTEDLKTTEGTTNPTIRLVLWFSFPGKSTIENIVSLQGRGFQGQYVQRS